MANKTIEIKQDMAFPCHLEIFKINGINADEDDFGDNNDHYQSYEDDDNGNENACQCHYFEANREPENIKKCIEKYNLNSEKDYLEICNLLEDTLYVGHCALCD